MTQSTLTAKGQTTVPLEIRRAMQALPGHKLMWTLMPDGTVVVRAKNKSIFDMVGMLKPAKGIKVSIEDMNPWR